MIGKPLAHYQVIAKLGEGGMGVVYRATDTRLGRDVAIKVLPATVASDPERLSRFEREARTLASLNHPNIAAIYGVEQGALVMELVEGQTLAERIQAGAIPLDEALPLLRQIADALEAAHEKGIIHRDLKPANVKITPDGVVKLLDFGLAKAMEADSSAAIPENSPTLTIGASRTGVIMGTAGYMSPEQARGGKVDRRTDIWAYGVVLYEMVAGRTLFQGETISDTLAAVLTREPDLDAVPARIRPLLRRCLQRDAKKRLGWIGEAAAALDQPPREKTAPPRRGWIVPVLAGLSLLSIGSVAALLMRTPKQPELPVRRFTVIAPALANSNTFRSAAISPDGKHLAFVAGAKLWIRDFDREDARVLEGTEGAAAPFWSPDSKFIGFWVQARGQVRKVNASGGAPVEVCRGIAQFNGGSWSADGETVFLATQRSGLMAAPASGGESRVVKQQTRETGGIAFSPNFLPAGAGGDWILLGVGSFAEQKMVAANIKTGERRGLGSGNFPTYAQSGHIIFSREGGGADGLWAVPFSLRDLRTTGEAFLVAAGGTMASVASDGALVYLDGGGFIAQLVLRDREGKPIGKAGAPQSGVRQMAASPDGQHAAVSSTEQGNPDIWIHDLGRSLKSRITFDPAVELYPRWSPDGKQIVFRRSNELVIQAADGSGGSVLAAGGEQMKSPSDWSADGRYIVYTVSGGTAGSNDIWYLKRTPDSGFDPIPFLQTPFHESGGRFSPNGRYMAYLSDETGRFELYVRPFPDGPGKWQVTTNGAVQPRWSRNGKGLFYLEGETLMAVETSAEAIFTAGAPKRLFATGNYQNEWNAAKYDVMPDDRFLVLESAEGSGARSPGIHVVENWLAAATQSNK